MNNLLMLVAFCNLAWPQTQTGSIAVFILSENEITVAADSRSVNSVTGIHDDTSCKIRAFGDKFFFVMAGPGGHKADAAGPRWSANGDAREAWRMAIRLGMVSSAQRLTDEVAEQWARSMESHFMKPTIMKALRSTLWGGNVLASGLFGSTNPERELAVAKVDIFVDLELFDSKGIVKLRHEISEGPKLVPGGSMGLGEIATEYIFETSARAKRDMEAYKRTISNLTPSAQYGGIASKLVEWSVSLHPRHEFLGLPVDELQLSKGGSIRWLKLKRGCKEQE